MDKFQFYSLGISDLLVSQLQGKPDISSFIIPIPGLTVFLAHNHLKVDCAIDRKCKSVPFILLLCGWSILTTLYSVLATLPLCWPPRPAPVSWPVPCPGKLQERSRVLGAPGSWGWRAWSHDHWLAPQVGSFKDHLWAANWWRLWTWVTELVCWEQWQGTLKGYWYQKIWVHLFLGP